MTSAPFCGYTYSIHGKCEKKMQDRQKMGDEMNRNGTLG